MRQLQLYRSVPHDCSYLEQQTAHTLFLDPELKLDMPLYGHLIDQGFRRSGDMIYRPDCNSCRACQSIRLPVSQFTPRRNQRRIWQRLQADIRVTRSVAEFRPNHFALFRRYLEQRHPDGEMVDTTPQGYVDFITSAWSDTCLLEFHYQQQLMAVAVTDILPQGLSAVYTFFDPAYSSLSPGVFTLLWQIEQCKKEQKRWLYLGYWIANCRKMAYKIQYQPSERYLTDHWEPFSQEKPNPSVG